jgi:hypothetical protein
MLPPCYSLLSPGTDVDATERAARAGHWGRGQGSVQELQQSLPQDGGRLLEEGTREEVSARSRSLTNSLLLYTKNHQMYCIIKKKRS